MLQQRMLQKQHYYCICLLSTTNYYLEHRSLHPSRRHPCNLVGYRSCHCCSIQSYYRYLPIGINPHQNQKITSHMILDIFSHPYLFRDLSLHPFRITIKEIGLLMKSSFKKVEKPTVSQRCVFGHPDLDAIFANSLSKGHLMVIEEDHPSTNWLALARYFISHHYSQGQTSIVYDSSPRWKFLISPPVKQDKEKEGKQGKEGKSEIAWRYDQMNIKLSHLALDERIAFTDLSKQVSNPKEELLKLNQYPGGSVRELYRHIEQSYMGAQVDQKDTNTKKLLLASLPAYCYQDKEFSGWLKAVRCLTRSSHLFTLITVPPILPPAARNALIKHADYYISVSKIAKGYEDFTGSLTILKEVESSSLRSQFRGVSVWGIKATRKEIRLQGLYEKPLEGEGEGAVHDF